LTYENGSLSVSLSLSLSLSLCSNAFLLAETLVVLLLSSTQPSFTNPPYQRKIEGFLGGSIPYLERNIRSSVKIDETLKKPNIQKAFPCLANIFVSR
jgi:hypothetical protein